MCGIEATIDRAELDPALINARFYPGMPNGRPGDAEFSVASTMARGLTFEVPEDSGSGPETGGPQWGGVEMWRSGGRPNCNSSNLI